MTIEAMIWESARNTPLVEGPVPVTGYSVPFCSMQQCRQPFKLSDYGYVEEEYLLNGTANVYDAGEGDKLALYKKALPYKNRILVRRPRDAGRFSGRVYVDILNATQGYDIEDLWHRCYLWCMENGHAYVGITSKPVNVLSLKNYDYPRYKDLNWSNGEETPMPVPSMSAAIPGTEEGLFWDMLSQLAVLLRRPEGQNCLGGFAASRLYLTGQSQSGAYLNTYIHYFDRYLSYGQDGPLFDGYCNIVGALVQRSVRQSGEIGPLKLLPRRGVKSKVPFICISSEADLYLFNLFVEEDLFSIVIGNADEEDDKCRYYEIPAAPHTDIACPVLSSLKEVARTGCKLPNMDPKLFEHLSDIPVEYYICALLDKLNIWASKGRAPETAPILKRDKSGLARDPYGHARGGLRSPYVDLPAASYTASNPDDPEGICGKMEPFTRERINKLYGSADDYLKRFSKYVRKQRDQGWVGAREADKMIERAAEHMRRI